MTLNNYEKTLLRAEKEFLRFDQGEMMANCGLTADEDYFYLTFFYAPYRIDRRSGHVERLCADGSLKGASFNEGMTIFDVLCEASPHRHISGQWVTWDHFTNVSFTGNGLYQPYADAFDRDPEILAEVCAALGAVPYDKGEVSFELKVFDFFPLILQFWESEEGIPASLSFLWDANTMDYLRFETTHYCALHILEELKQRFEQLYREK